MAKCGCACGSGLSDEQKKILTVMSTMAAPAAGKEIAEAVGMEAKAVSCKLTGLKNKGYIDSPVRCKYAITAAGKAAL
jgi:predicted transcriptional regulator